MKTPIFFLITASLLSGATFNEFPSISMNQSGDAIVVWEGYDAENLNHTIREARHPLGGSWTSPTSISPSSKTALYPKVAMNEDGQIVAVWEVVLDSLFSIQASNTLFGTPGWSAPETISESTTDDTFPEIDIDSFGNGLLLWQKKSGGTLLVRASSYSSSSHTWSDPLTLSDPSRTMPFPEAVVNGSGKAVAFWQQFNGTANEIRTSTSTLGDPWSASLILSDPAFNSTSVQAAINASGQVVAIWQKGTTSGVDIEAAICSPEGTWGPVISLSTSGSVSTNPIVTLNTSGKIIALWQTSSPSNLATQTIQAAVYSGESWSSPTTLSDPLLKARNPQLSLNSAGKALAVWSANNVIQAAVLSSDNTWSSVVELSDPSQASLYPQVGIDALGNGVAVWQSSFGSDQEIQASIYTVGGSWNPKATISP